MLRKIIIGIVLITAYFFAMPDSMRNYVMAKRGNAEAQYNLGMLYRQQDDQQAVDWLAKSGNQGFANAQQELGSIYEHGAGVVKQDYQQAVNWYTKSAEQNNAVAQRCLATMYYTGTGVAQNNQLAIVWITKSAENGDGLAQALLATAYATGEGIAQDLKKAYMWFSVYAVTDPSPVHLDDVSPHLTPADMDQARSDAAVLIKKIEANKAHKK